MSDDFLGAVTPYQRELLEEFAEQNPDVEIPQGTASVEGIPDVVSGAVDSSGTVIPSSSDEPKLEFLGTAINSPVPLAYGRHLVAGAPIFQHRLETTTPKKTILFIALGEGEWEGPEVVWVNGQEIDLADTNLIHFHPGKDGEEDGSFAPIVESDPPAAGNQKVCFFMPASFTRMTFSKTAYISLQLPDDPLAPGPAFDVRGIYKTRKVRIFDASGNETSYAYSANPAWQLLDAFISLHLKPHGSTDEPLMADEKARIDFAAFKAAADFCDVDIGGGIKRFESHVVFLSETNLATIFDTLLALCRGYLVEQEGKLGLFIDQSRTSQFTFTKSNVLASTFQAPEKPLRSLANRLIIKTRDIESGGGTVSKDFAPWTKTIDDEAHQDRVGRIIKKEFDLGANSKERAERVGRYWMDRSLKLSEQGRLVASPDAGALLPGDRVLGPSRTDFSQTRDWEVLDISDNPDGTRELFVQAYDETVFSDTADPQQDVEETIIPVTDRWRKRNIKFPSDSEADGTGLRVHFSFDSGDGIAYGRGPDAVKIVGANVIAIEGVSGKGIECDDADGRFNYGSDFVASGMTSHSISFWTNEGGGSEGGTWRNMIRGNAGGDNHVIVRQSDTQLGMIAPTPFKGCGFLMNTLSVGWHHVVAVAHDSQTDFYVDGEFVGTSSAKTTAGIQVIGNIPGGAQSWGAFDEVRIYDRALEAKEILALFQNPQGPQTQDNVPDGFDFGGVLNTALTGNEVDLAKSGVVGKAIELVRNPNFESGDRDWAKAAGFTIENDAANAYDGDWVGKFIGTGVAELRNAIFIPIQEGDVLMVSCMIKRVSGDGNPLVSLSWRDASKVELSNTNGNAVTSSSYALSRVVAVAPSGTFFASIEARAGNPTASQTAYYDQFQATFFPKDLDDIEDSAVWARTHGDNLTNGDVDLAKSVVGKSIELVRNPNFESGDRDWNKGTDFTIENDAANAYDGNWVGKYVGTVASVIRNGIAIPIQPGDVLMASCMVKRTSGDGSPAVRISWRDASKAELSTTGGNAVTSSSYALSRVVAVAPSGTFFAVVEAVSGTPTVSQTAYYDQFQATFFPQGDLAELDQVDTAEVVDNAVTDDDNFANDANIEVFTDTSVADVTVATDGGNVLLVAKARLDIGYANPGRFRIRKGTTSGTILDTAEWPADIDTVRPLKTLIAVDTSPAASQTYHLTGTKDSGATQVDERKLFAFNLKK